MSGPSAEKDRPACTCSPARIDGYLIHRQDCARSVTRRATPPAKPLPSAEKDVLREAADLIRRERGAHPFHAAVADWLEEAADHLDAHDDADAFPPGSVCPTALEGLECSMLEQAVKVARTYVLPPGSGDAA